MSILVVCIYTVSARAVHVPRLPPCWDRDPYRTQAVLISCDGSCLYVCADCSYRIYIVRLTYYNIRNLYALSYILIYTLFNLRAHGLHNSTVVSTVAGCGVTIEQPKASPPGINYCV